MNVNEIGETAAKLIYKYTGNCGLWTVVLVLVLPSLFLILSFLLLREGGKILLYAGLFLMCVACLLVPIGWMPFVMEKGWSPAWLLLMLPMFGYVYLFIESEPFLSRLLLPGVCKSNDSDSAEADHFETQMGCCHAQQR